jgi:large subunit ribosomal protein L17
MLANMACSLIEHKRINTTVAKAKALKQFVEPNNKIKTDTTHNRRICLLTYVANMVTDLFRDVAAKWRSSRWIHVSLKLEIVWEIMLIWQ